MLRLLRLDRREGVLDQLTRVLGQLRRARSREKRTRRRQPAVAAVRGRSWWNRKRYSCLLELILGSAPGHLRPAQHDDVALLKRSRAVTACASQDLGQFDEHSAILAGQGRVGHRISQPKLDVRRRERIVECNERSAVGKRYKLDAGPFLERAIRGDHDDGLSGVADQLGDRRGIGRDVRLNDRRDGAAQVHIHRLQRRDHVVRQGDGDSPRGADELPRATAPRLRRSRRKANAVIRRRLAGVCGRRREHERHGEHGNDQPMTIAFFARDRRKGRRLPI